MVNIIALAVGALIWYSVVSSCISFRANVKAAKASGIPYKVVPVYFLTTWWLVGHPLFQRLFFRHLPESWTKWIELTQPNPHWDYRYDFFKRRGHDTFLTASPGGLSLYTADPAVINQITTRRNDFPKPCHIYTSLDIYGKNVVSTEGHAWRQHRKATSPPFTEKNNHLVWAESIRQAQAMLSSWVGPDGKGDRTVDRVMDDTMRLSLHVITCAGFGRKLDWPTEDVVTKKETGSYVDASKIHNQQDDTDEGHSMSYTYSLHCLLDNILFQFLLPRWTLKYGNTNMRKANESYIEWGNYMREALNKKKSDIESGISSDQQMDIMAQLAKSQIAEKEGKGTAPALTDEELLGNMFVLILAGHETAANSIHFALVYLALHLESQRNLQRDLEKILQGRSPSQWNYDQDLPALFGGMAGAVLAEELRLAPPVTGIPKSTFKVSDQTLTIDGKECTVPADTYINLCSTGVHRNPKYWPVGPPRLPGGRPAHPCSNIDNDLEEFRPERWLENDTSSTEGDSGASMPTETMTTDDTGVNLSSDTSDAFFKPPKGAYIPFSEGYRACLGRRFAQVEVLAVLAVIFQNYSVEIAVDKYANDKEVAAMNAAEKAEVWQKAAEDARELLTNGMGVIITLQIRKGTIPVRLVRKSHERFPTDVDETWKKNNPDKVSAEGRSEWSNWRGTENDRRRVPRL